MKIAFFTNNYLPNTGGAAIAVESYREALEKLGHEVFVFAPKYPPWFPRYKDDSNKKVWRFPSFALKFITPQPIPLYFSFFVEDFFKKQNFDIVHSHHPFVIGKTALKLAKKYRIPIVFTHHTQYHKYVHYIPLIPEKISAKFAIQESVKYANQVDLVIAPTKEIKEMIINFGVKTRIEILPTGIDFSLWEKDISEEFLKNFPWKDKRILLYAGRLAKEKNIPFLFYSLEKLLKNRDDTIFLVVGDGEEKKNLENLIKKLNLEDKIILMGWYPREELVNFYKIAEIFVFASTTETQGLVTLEAMAGECAVVAIRAPGSMSLIEDGKEGFLVEEDLEEFSNKVELLLNNPELLKMMQKNAKIKAQEFSIDRSAIKLEELYRELIKNKEK
ncbi:glycosyltransferase family 4 protein [Dictyoglomus thermophilum]|uniref:Glycosyltransferase n=1 Tax=Dictyoglomus thermophilum (strain ATCC 35947 / DSM 3960 / H-6-12) TaxID=309799 RepID=B5YDS1_DICT6|nr:glycosyltransferase family 4 protein [Dictyoglomus thermophilum]ACI19201.1 glycosyltransferase [Dictyoglomus thermophilum H-6-12]MCX7721192.1 glycosyltransferase family 4 protein [Dictyoglomus thermophilum]